MVAKEAVMKTPQNVSAQDLRLSGPSQNRSLERGVEILRAFRPGADLLGNGELAERTGLSRATISRLTQTLVGTGLLEHDQLQRAYRLAAPVLSLAHAMRSGSPVLQVAAPMMRKVAEKLKINVGLAVADGDEMVYLEAVRYNRKVSLRNVVAGQRVPIELTSLGRAWLAVAPQARREAFLGAAAARRGAGWADMAGEIARAVELVRLRGFCAASWQAEVVALATPLVVEGYPIYALNMSVATQDSVEAVTGTLAAPLLDLSVRIRAALVAGA